jgi:hypothetical protein
LTAADTGAYHHDLRPRLPAFGFVMLAVSRFERSVATPSLEVAQCDRSSFSGLE